MTLWDWIPVNFPPAQIRKTTQWVTINPRQRIGSRDPYFLTPPLWGQPVVVPKPGQLLCEPLFKFALCGFLCWDENNPEKTSLFSCRSIVTWCRCPAFPNLHLQPREKDVAPAGLLREQSLKEVVQSTVQSPFFFKVKGGQALWAIRSLEFYCRDIMKYVEHGDSVSLLWEAEVQHRVQMVLVCSVR